ncbi:MAG: hypothetical protein E6Q97_10655 [Desulfurellales bacterium]|nr:MAG: hypothetical protein E6Q97_10655 [Desulfurellales bacterium]
MPLQNRSLEADIVRRSFALRVDSMSDEGPGGGSGTACAMGTLDSYRSVWSPRAFGKDVLKTSVSDGFMTPNHDWEEDCGTIEALNVSRNELKIDWLFYTDDDSQKIRTKCKDRKDRGKSIGLSIGAAVNWQKCADFDSGEKLWTYAEGLGEDMSLYDPAIRKHKGYCWIIPEVTRLFEVAITNAPAVPGSRADEIRSTNDLLRSGDLGALTFADALDMVLGAVQGIEARALEVEALRAENDGRIGRDNLKRLQALRDSLDSIIGRNSQTRSDDEAAIRLMASRLLAG